MSEHAELIDEPCEHHAPQIAMSDPTVLIQFSDPHLGADWGGPDPERSLAAAVERVRELRVEPAGVLVTGDLAEEASREACARLAELVAPLAAPVSVLPGNHDDRELLRRGFALPGDRDEPILYSARVGSLRLLALDTIIPGDDGGEIGEAGLAWLDAELEAAPDAPTLVAMHHPPIPTGIPAFDEIGLADRDEFAAIVARHPQVLRIAAGHVHRVIAGDAGGRPVLVAPSTYMSTLLKLGPGEIESTTGSTGFVVHTLIDGELVSHVQTLDAPAR